MRKVPLPPWRAYFVTWGALFAVYLLAQVALS
jgi:hypothetical protein